MVRLNIPRRPALTAVGAISLENNLRRMIVGQDEAIRQIVDIYKMHLTGMGAPGRPIGNFLILGPQNNRITQYIDALDYVRGRITALRDELGITSRVLTMLFKHLAALRMSFVRLLLSRAAFADRANGKVSVEINFFNYHGTGRPPQLEWVLKMDPVPAF